MTTPKLNIANVGQPRKLTPPQKAAVIIGLLGRNSAKPIFDRFEEEDLRFFGLTMSSLGEIDKDTINATIAEFLTAITQTDNGLTGTVEQVLSLMSGQVSDTMLSRLRFELDKGNSQNIWKTVSNIPAADLAASLASEHPQVAAIVLTKLGADHAAAVVNALPLTTAQQVISAIANMAVVQGDVADEIGRLIAEQFFKSETVAKPPSDFSGTIGALLNYVASTSRDALLSHLDTQNGDFARSVRQHMFTFPDIATRIDKKDFAKIARAVDQGTLLKALSGAALTAPDVSALILENISSRLADQLREALSEIGDVDAADADAAQTEIVRAIRKLETDGELALIRADFV